MQHLIDKSLHVCRHLAHHLGSLCCLSHLDFHLGLSLSLLGRAALCILAVIEGTSAVGIAATAAIVRLILKDVVDTITGAAASIVDAGVLKPTTGHLADTLLHQQLIDDIVSSTVPLARVAITTAEIVLQHGVHDLVCREELEFLISQRVDKLRVEHHPLAVGRSSGDPVRQLERHVESDGPDERMLKDQAGLGLGKAAVKCRCVSHQFAPMNTDIASMILRASSAVSRRRSGSLRRLSGW